MQRVEFGFASFAKKALVQWTCTPRYINATLFVVAAALVVNCWCTEKLHGPLGSLRCCSARDGSTCRMPLQRRLRRDGSFHSLLRSSHSGSVSALHAETVSRTSCLTLYQTPLSSVLVTGDTKTSNTYLASHCLKENACPTRWFTHFCSVGFHRFTIVSGNISRLKWIESQQCSSRSSGAMTAQAWTIRVKTWTTVDHIAYWKTLESPHDLLLFYRKSRMWICSRLCDLALQIHYGEKWSVSNSKDEYKQYCISALDANLFKYNNCNNDQFTFTKDVTFSLRPFISFFALSR